MNPLEEYKRRCRGATKSLSPAVVVWQKSYKMEVGREAAINVALSLRTSAPPTEILPSATSPTSAQVLVACRVTGTLAIDTATFSLAAETPRAQSVKIVSFEDARWHWLVTPKKPGSFTVSTYLQPIVTIQDQSNPQLFDETLPGRSFDARVVVSSAPPEAITEAASRWTKVLLGMTALIAALTGLLAALSKLLTGAWLPWRASKSKAEKDRN
jgi:hypothetical protein